MTITINPIAGDDVINIAENNGGLITVSGTAPAFSVLNMTLLPGSAGTFPNSVFVPSNGQWSASLTLNGSANAFIVSADFLSESAARNVTVDGVRPTVTSITLSDSALTGGETALVTIQFSEAVT